MTGSTEPKIASPSSHQLDLLGEVCPYTYVRTKLALEELNPGDILLVRVDQESARQNVPRAAALDGHEILSVVEERTGCWAITIKAGHGG